MLVSGLAVGERGLARRRLGARAGVAAIVCLMAATPVFSQPPTPELTRPVNDFANVIDPGHEAEIERRILALKQATARKNGRDGAWSSPYGDVVAVATVETFAPYADIAEYAVKMFENRGRGIGERGRDNGLLVVLAVKDRDVRVEVGYDLEQFITDGFAGEVSRNDMRPHFVRGDYGEGLLAGSTRLIDRIAQARGVTLTGAPVAVPDRRPEIRISPWVILAIIILVVLMSGSGGGRSRLRRRRTHWGGGAWSGWNSGVGPFGGGGRIGGGGFGGGFGGFGGGRSGGGGGGASW